MSVVYVLVFVAIIMASAFLIAFVWAVRNGQFDDTYTPSVRILFDDPPLVNEAENDKPVKKNVIKKNEGKADS